jgi:hypothetical protein
VIPYFLFVLCELGFCKYFSDKTITTQLLRLKNTAAAIIKPNSAKGTQRLGRSLKLIKKSKIKLQLFAASPSLNREIIEIEQRVSKIC